MIRRWTIACAVSLLTFAGLAYGGRAAAVQPPPAGPMTAPLPGAGETRTELPDGRWLIVGGERDTGPSGTIAVFDLARGTSIPIPTTLFEARAWHTATILADGAILIAGGLGADGRALASVERFDLATETV